MEMNSMAESRWKEDYDRLLELGKKSGDVIEPVQGQERRQNPRFRLRTETIWVKVEPRFSVIDVSISGISFYSNHLFRPGNRIQTSLGKAFSVEAEVLECEMVESDPDFMEAMYQVRCKFVNEAQGMQFLVMLKEMDNEENEVTIS